MNYSGLSSILEQAYAPLSSYEFAKPKEDEEIQAIVQDSMLYAICHRPMLTFENFVLDPNERGVRFEIHQQNSPCRLVCFLPYNQPTIATCDQVAFGYYDARKGNQPLPEPGINGLHFLDKQKELVLWLSPDKFLHLYWKGHLTATVTGDHRQFTNFMVHYVGKATGQPVMERLTGHDTLQDILSSEGSMVPGTLPAHEIMLLLFRARPDAHVATLGDDEADVDDFVDMAHGKGTPSQKTLSLDAEKVLVNLLSPEYNHITKRFPNYPKSTDGLYKYNFNRFCYQIKEDITLVYDKVSIKGGVDGATADIIAINANSTVEILKHS